MAKRSFLSELQRRRVLRVAGAYLAASFLVLQGADYLFRALLFPEWAFRLVVLLVVVGFVLAVPLAWAFDIGPGGVRRTPAQAADDVADAAAGVAWRGPPLWAVAGVVVLASGAAAGGWFAFHRPGEVVHPRRLVVAPFENKTGDPRLASLGDMAADWITQGLSESGIVEVADGSTALAVSRQAATQAGVGPGDLVRLVSRATGSGLVVTGRYYAEGDSVVFVAQVVDARSGKLLRMVGPVAAARDAPANGAERLRQRLLGELAIMLDQRLARFQPLDSHPPSYEAYREFIEGVRSRVADDFRQADLHFSRAFALDTLFYRALLSAAASAAFADEARFRSLAAKLDGLRDRLSPVEQYTLDWLRAYVAGDKRAAYAAARQVSELAPGSDAAAWELALAAGRVHRYRESLALLRGIDPNQGLSRWKFYWAYMAGAQHATGDYEGELRSAAEMARHSPASPLPDALRLSALAALGRTGDVAPLAMSLAERVVGDSLGLREFSDAEALGFQAPTPASAFLIGARELLVHGHAAAGRSLAAEGLQWCAARSPGEQADPWFRWARAQLLGYIGRWREADALLAQGSGPPTWAALYEWNRALIAAELRDTTRARELDRGLAVPSFTSIMPYFHVTIAAALGDRAAVRARLRDAQAAGGDYGEWWMHSEPTLAPYLGDPEFRQLFGPAE